MKKMVDWRECFLSYHDGNYATFFNEYLAFVADAYDSLISVGQPNFDKPVYLGLMMSPAQLAVLRANRHLFDERFQDALERLQKSYDELKVEVG